MEAYGAIENIVVAIPGHLHLDIGGIRGSNARLGHEESRADLAIQQRRQPLLLLCLIAVLCQHLHVSSIWSRTVDGLRGELRASKVLRHQAILEVGEAWGLLVVALWQEHVPQAELACLGLEVIDDGWVGVLKSSVSCCFPGKQTVAEDGHTQRPSPLGI